MCGQRPSRNDKGVYIFNTWNCINDLHMQKNKFKPGVEGTLKLNAKRNKHTCMSNEGKKRIICPSTFKYYNLTIYFSSKEKNPTNI